MQFSSWLCGLLMLIIGPGAAWAQAPILTRQVCLPFENLQAADDNTEFTMWSVSTVVRQVGCHCAKGACTTPAELAFHDRSGNPLTTDATVTCSSGPSNTVYRTVTAGGALQAGEGLQFDVINAIDPETDQYLICVTTGD